MSGRKLRGHNAGSIYYHTSRKCWVAAISVPGGARRRRQAKTRPEAEALLAAMLRREAGPTISAARASMEAIVRRYLEWARAEGWSDAMLARVMATGLTTARIKAGLVGPCAYCGTPLADEVDHVIARTRGGTDDPANLVSACSSCNAAKGNKGLHEFLSGRW